MKNKMTKLRFLVLTALLAAVMFGFVPAANNAGRMDNANIAPNANGKASAEKRFAGCYDSKINNAIRTAIKERPNFNKIIRQINWNS